MPDQDVDQAAVTGEEQHWHAASNTNVTPLPVDLAPGDPVRIHRRRRRQTLTFLGGFLSVLGIGGLAYGLYVGAIAWPFDKAISTPAAAACDTAKKATLQPAASTLVRVYNGSSHKGMAATVARDLQKRHFVVPELPANDPLEARLTTSAVIRYGAEGLVAAHTVATQLTGSVAFVKDDRSGDQVDLVIGTNFKLQNAAKSAQLLRAGLPTPCS